MRIYAVGDIHGQLDRLREVHALIATDRRQTGDWDAPVVHLGDLVDRGPDSAGVVAYLAAGPARGGRWISLKGNHDNMFALFLETPSAVDPSLRADLTWLDRRLGGMTTLASYGIAAPEERTADELHAEARACVPASHRAFMRALPLYFQTPDVAFAHAGIRPGVPLADQTEEDLIWIRRPFLDDSRDHGALIVHGHTPVDEAEHHGNRVNLDTGAGYGRDLTCAVFEGRQVSVLTTDGRRSLRPSCPDRSPIAALFRPA